LIFLLTNKSDIHPNNVINQLKNNSYPFFRLNTEDLLFDYKLNFTFSPEFDFAITNIHNGKSVRKNDIGAIWERRPSLPSIQEKLGNSSLHELSEKESSEFLFWFRYFVQDAYWLGHPIYDRWAGSKIKQLYLAKNFEINIPKTYIGNNKEDALKLFKDIQNLALKPLSEDWINYKDEEYAFFTQLISIEEIKKIPSEIFENTINYIQEYIPKLFELRVTVVGKEIFACKIDSQVLDEAHGKIDWRQSYDSNVVYTKYELDNRTKKFCLNYLNKLNLNFGCFDFIVTPESELYFLECNPNGQWLWIEEESGLQISKAIANLLISEDEIRKN